MAMTFGLSVILRFEGIAVQPHDVVGQQLARKYACISLAFKNEAANRSRPVLQRFLSNLMIVLGCIAFAVVGLGPRGGAAALCFSPSHGPGDIIVARTPAGGHAHAPQHASGRTQAATHHNHECNGHAHDDCTDSQRSSHHHDAEHGPCADIPLDQDEYRNGSGSSSIKASGKNAADASATHAHACAAWLSVMIEAGSAGPPRAGSAVRRGAGHAIAHAQIISSIRTVILQV